MESKYYTPTIEEFHVGFEYEQKDVLTGDWVSLVVTPASSLITLATLIEYSFVRVKYLDKEDIKSFGFTTTEDFKDAYHLANTMYMFKGYIIVQVKWNNKLLILSPNYYRDNSGNYNGFTTHFKGDIKNKSELKVLLKQLNIITDG